MKRLFAIRDNKTDKMYGKDFYEKKGDARSVREALNENKANRYSIMLGPDHYLYKENSEINPNRG